MRNPGLVRKVHTSPGMCLKSNMVSRTEWSQFRSIFRLLFGVDPSADEALSLRLAAQRGTGIRPVIRHGHGTSRCADVAARPRLISRHNGWLSWAAVRPVLSGRLLVGVAIGLEDFLEAHHAFQFAKVRTVDDGQKGQIAQPAEGFLQIMVGVDMRQRFGRNQAAQGHARREWA